MLTLLRPKAGDEEQSGINMVDLMMWLVIAALLLASAIQGIGYYQQNANIYQMKEALGVAKSRTMAIAANDGSLDVSDVDNVVAEENAERSGDQITLSVGTISSTAAGESNDTGFELTSFAPTTTVGAGEAIYIRAVHSGVSKYDVIHLFKDIASKKEGTHLVNKGTTDAATPGGTPTSQSSASPSPSSTATATPSPSATAAPTTSPSPTPTPTPTPYSPENTNAASATLRAGANEHLSPKYSNKSFGAGGTAPVYTGFVISQEPTVKDPSNFTVEWSGHGLDEANVVLGAGIKGTYGTELQWYVPINAKTSEGYKEGVFYVIARVTNLTTKEVTVRTWTHTVQPQAMKAAPAGSGDQWFNNRTTKEMTSSTIPFRFTMSNTTASDYTVTWSTDGGGNAKVAQTSNVYGSSGAILYHSDIAPNAEGWTVGTTTVTAVAKHNITGKEITYTRTITVSAQTFTAAPAGSGDQWFHNRSNREMSSSTIPFRFTLPGAATSDFTITWKTDGGGNAKTAQTGNVYGSSGSHLYHSDIAPNAEGWTVGTTTVTAIAKHNATGRELTYTRTITVQAQTFTAAPAGSGDQWFNSRNTTIGNTATIPFRFTLPGAATSDFTITWSTDGGGNAVVAQTGLVYGSSGSHLYHADIKPGTGGFAAGTVIVTAVAKHNATGREITYTRSIWVK